MKRLHVILVLIPLLGLSCVAAGWLATANLWSVPGLHIGAVALTPATAVADMLNNRGTVRNFQAQTTLMSTSEALVVYNYTITHAGWHQPEFGYALVELRTGGWSVHQANMQSSQAVPGFATAQLDHRLLIYGPVADPQAVAIEVVLNDSTTMSTTIENGSFMLLVPGTQSVDSVHIVKAPKAMQNGP